MESKGTGEAVQNNKKDLIKFLHAYALVARVYRGKRRDHSRVRLNVDMELHDLIYEFSSDSFCRQDASILTNWWYRKVCPSLDFQTGSGRFTRSLPQTAFGDVNFSQTRVDVK